MGGVPCIPPGIMRYASAVDRLAHLGSAKWAVHIAGRQRAARGEKLIFLSIGEPDLPPPGPLSMWPTGRCARSSPLFGGPRRTAPPRGARPALHQTDGRNIGAEQFLFLPGTQAALACAFLAIIEPGDEVLLLDPYYATYEAVVTAPGGIPVPVPLDPDRGFHPDITAIEKAVTPKTKAILLNSPSNPTGAVFTRAENLAIGEIAKSMTSGWCRTRSMPR